MKKFLSVLLSTDLLFAQLAGAVDFKAPKPTPNPSRGMSIGPMLLRSPLETAISHETVSLTTLPEIPPINLEQGLAAFHLVPTALSASDSPKNVLSRKTESLAWPQKPVAQGRTTPTGMRRRLLDLFRRPISQTTLNELYAGDAPTGKGVEDTITPGAQTPPGKQLRVFLVRPDKAPVSSDLADLKTTLSEPGLLEELNKHGHVRHLLGADHPNNGYKEADTAQVDEFLKTQGLSIGPKRTRIETLLVNWRKDAASDASSDQAPKRPTLKEFLSDMRAESPRFAVIAGVIGLGTMFFGFGHIYTLGLAGFLIANADRLVRETLYCAKTLKAAFSETKAPLPSEVLGALATKGPGFAMNVIANLTAYLPLIGILVLGHIMPSMAAKIQPGDPHMVAFALATLWALALVTFHGLGINAWNNFQNKIGAQRGLSYQSVFGFAYMQLTGSIFRIIAFLSLSGIIAPWDVRYLRDISAMTILGTICGVLGFKGLNSLYNKGVIQRWQRSGIQQIRDLFFLVVGPFFNTGNMFMTYLLLAIQYSVDITLYFRNKVARTKPLLIITDTEMAQTLELAQNYPINPDIVEEPPIKQAMKALESFILLKPFFILGYALRDWLRAKRA